jgi:hypothetical protein
VPPGQSLPFSHISKSLRITAGPCPGRAQRAVGKPGRVAEIPTITLEKMAGRHLHIFCRVPLALLSRFHPHSLSRLQDHRRSVAILPSALLLSIYLLGASWAFLVSAGAATWMSLSGSALADQEPALCRSHPNSAILLICILSIRMDSG